MRVNAQIGSCATERYGRRSGKYLFVDCMNTLENYVIRFWHRVHDARSIDVCVCAIFFFPRLRLFVTSCTALLYEALVCNIQYIYNVYERAYNIYTESSSIFGFRLENRMRHGGHLPISTEGISRMVV